MEKQESEQLRLMRFDVARAAFELDEFELPYLAFVAKAVAISNGCDTPAEEFLKQQIDAYHRRCLTPDEVADDLPEFRRNMEETARIARQFAARFPELMAEPETEVCVSAGQGD